MKYKVSIGRTAYEYAEIEIEAENEEQAREEAENLIDESEIDFKPMDANHSIISVEPQEGGHG